MPWLTFPELTLSVHLQMLLSKVLLQHSSCAALCPKASCSPGHAADVTHDVTHADGWPRLALGKAALSLQGPLQAMLQLQLLSVVAAPLGKEQHLVLIIPVLVSSEESGNKPK